jgi:hypothetical protein
VGLQLYLTQLLVTMPTVRIGDLPARPPNRWKGAQKIRLASLQNRSSQA